VEYNANLSYEDPDAEGRGEEDDGNEGGGDENMIVVSIVQLSLDCINLEFATHCQSKETTTKRARSLSLRKGDSSFDTGSLSRERTNQASTKGKWSR
jgi:hypothetical protein